MQPACIILLTGTAVLPKHASRLPLCKLGTVDGVCPERLEGAEGPYCSAPEPQMSTFSDAVVTTTAPITAKHALAALFKFIRNEAYYEQ